MQNSKYSIQLDHFIITKHRNERADFRLNKLYINNWMPSSTKCIRQSFIKLLQ